MLAGEESTVSTLSLSSNEPTPTQIQNLKGPTHSVTQGGSLELGGHGLDPAGICSLAGRSHDRAVPRLALRPPLDPPCPDHIHCQAWVHKDGAITDRILPYPGLGLNPDIRTVGDFDLSFWAFRNFSDSPQ